MIQKRSDRVVVRRVLDIIAERRFAYYERHDATGDTGCRALDGASHEIAKTFGMLADALSAGWLDAPCPCPCHVGGDCLRFPTCCNVPPSPKSSFPCT